MQRSVCTPLCAGTLVTAGGISWSHLSLCLFCLGCDRTAAAQEEKSGRSVALRKQTGRTKAGRHADLTLRCKVKVLTQGALLLHRLRRYDSFAVWRRPKRTKVGGVLCRCPPTSSLEDDEDDWCHPDEHSSRCQLREYREQMDIAQLTNDDLYKRYRVNHATLAYIIAQLDAASAPNTDRSQSLSTGYKVLITLRYLATGVIQLNTGDLHSIQAPSIDEPMYVNRMGYHSINTQVMLFSEKTRAIVIASSPSAVHPRMGCGKFSKETCFHRMTIFFWVIVGIPANAGSNNAQEACNSILKIVPEPTITNWATYSLMNRLKKPIELSVSQSSYAAPAAPTTAALCLPITSITASPASLANNFSNLISKTECPGLSVMQMILWLVSKA
ncbi:hypothetical protein DPMN_073720 [Dreissena polymorpha]|uniref:Uncharacterized protein n=1 Tax=Dreissena polymorpha TaxID=45954 RepID=A0A9D4BZR7_DREPO|nr:hypothetical protein DPMN_073720 [Dreissena polymorpha]